MEKSRQSDSGALPGRTWKQLKRCELGTTYTFLIDLTVEGLINPNMVPLLWLIVPKAQNFDLSNICILIT